MYELMMGIFLRRFDGLVVVLGMSGRAAKAGVFSILERGNNNCA